MQNINLIVIHCSATREDTPYTVADLDRDHCARGFDGPGYHFYIRKDGSVWTTRPIWKQGAHFKGFNKNSIGICYEGGLDRKGRSKDTRTPSQKQSMRLLVEKLLSDYPSSRVCGHRDLSPDTNGNGIIEPHEWLKECPCFEVKEEKYTVACRPVIYFRPG